MSNKKKNSNYVTDKTIAAKAEKEAAKLKEKKAKTTRIAAIWIGGAAAFLVILFGILIACGAFTYSPEATYHATINIEGHDALHVELFGNDAPKTVKHFIDLCEDGYFDGKSIHTLLDGLLYGGSQIADGGSSSIKGEFSDNGFDNKVPMKKGVIAMARGNGNDSAYGQFFFLTENDSSLKGKYAAFGKVSDMDVFEELIESLSVGDDGKINDAPKITGISLHASH
nr:peptidylprolyl isomerase [Oscillospiraceae bacterium]